MGRGTVVTVGDYNNFPVELINPPPDPDPSLTIFAELICPPEEDFAPPSISGAPYTSTWNMMFRNVYAFDFNSFYPEYSWKAEIRSVGAHGGDSKVDPFSNEKYLRLFGLDRYLSSGEWGNDGYLDVRQGVIDFYNGYLMLPSLTPFDVSRNELGITFSGGPPDYSDSLSSTLVDSISANLVRNSEIYDQIISVNSPPNKYDIVIELRKYDGD